MTLVLLRNFYATATVTLTFLTCLHHHHVFHYSSRTWLSHNIVSARKEKGRKMKTVAVAALLCATATAFAPAAMRQVCVCSIYTMLC